MKIPNMKEKTLRYLGHIDYIRVLKETGFFSKEPIDVKGMQIRPIDLTSQLLFSKWKLGSEDEEFTVMKITIKGTEAKIKKTITYNLYDKFDSESKISSMARTTGFTATAVARLLISGKYKRKGIIPPEFIGEDEYCFKFILDYQRNRNINYQIKDETY
jgi:saccharopine dehydrogenase-like NADP-dependent oxidoreductase